MEDPIVFDLWATAVAERQSSGRALLSKHRPELDELGVRQLIANNVVSRKWILLTRNAQWSNVDRLRADFGEAFGEIEVYQSGYGPSDRSFLEECPVHSLHYTGVLGCPVCDDRRA